MEASDVLLSQNTLPMGLLGEENAAIQHID